MEEGQKKSYVTAMFANCEWANDHALFMPEVGPPVVGWYKTEVYSKQHVLHSKHLSLGYHQIFELKEYVLELCEGMFEYGADSEENKLKQAIYKFENP